MRITRRDMLELTALGSASLMVSGRSLFAAGPPTIGVQLYTVRRQMGTDAAGTLKAIADIGYKEVELLRATMDTVGPLARKVGLSPVSVHVDASIITGTHPAPQGGAATEPQPDLAAVIRSAKALGTKYLVLPYLAPGERGSGAAFYIELGDKLNRAGEQIKNAGMQLCYHNHGFEFETLPDGKRMLDLLMSSVKPELVKLELDVFWVSVAGADPLALLNQYKGRIALLHLKDKAKGTPVETQESKVSRTAFAEVGSGVLDFPAILKAAGAAGVEHYFVEQDETPGDPIASLRKSFEYLRTV